MPYMYDTVTGKQRYVADDQVEDLWKTGQVAFPKGTMVNITAGGRHGAISESQLSQAFAQGATYDTMQQRVLRNEKTYYDDQGHKAFAMGLGRGVMGKLSDAAMVATGVTSKERITKIMDSNPIAALAGTGVGMVGTAVMSGGTGAFGAAARLTPTGAGAHFGKILGTKVGTAAGMAGKGAAQGRWANAAGGIAEGAVDAGIYEVADTIGEEMLGRPGSFAENLIADVSVGMFVGAGIGGVLGAAGRMSFKGDAMNTIAELQYGGKLKDGNKIYDELLLPMFDGNETLAKKALWSLEGGDDGKFVQELLDSKQTWEGTKGAATKATVELVDSVLQLGRIERAIVSGQGKAQAWTKLIEESPESLANTNPKQVFDQAVDLHDDILRRFDALEEVSPERVAQGGLESLREHVKQARSEIMQAYSKDTKLPPGASLEWDDARQGYQGVYPAKEVGERTPGAKRTVEAAREEALETPAVKRAKKDELADEEAFNAELQQEQLARADEIRLEIKHVNRELDAAEQASKGRQKAVETELRQTLKRVTKARNKPNPDKEQIRRLQKKVDELKQSVKDSKKLSDDESAAYDLLDELQPELHKQLDDIEASGISMDRAAAARGEIVEVADKFGASKLKRGDTEWLGHSPEATDRMRQSMPMLYGIMNQTKRILDSKAFKDLSGIEFAGDAALNVDKMGRGSSLKQMADGFRVELENVVTWGAAGKAQNRINKPFSAVIASSGQFTTAFGYKRKGIYDEVTDSLTEDHVADANAIRNFIKQLTDGSDLNEGVRNVELMDRFLSNMQTFQKRIQEVFGEDAAEFLTPEFKALASKVTDQEAAMRTSWKELEQVGTGRKLISHIAKNAENGPVRDLMQGIGGNIGWKIGSSVGGAVGGATLGPAGAGAGMILGGAGGAMWGKFMSKGKNPTQKLKKLADMQAKALEAKSNYTKQVDKAVKGLTGEKGVVAKFKKGVGESGAWRRTMVHLLARNNHTWESKDKRGQQEEAVTTLMGWRADPGTLTQKLEVATAALGGEAPQVQAALQEQLTKICMYAANNVDPAIQVGQNPFTGEQHVSGPDYAFGKLDDMMMVVEVGLPFIVDNMVNGTLTPTMIIAWKQNFPEQHANFCSDLMVKIAPMGKEIDYASRGMISRAFDLPIDPTYDPDNINVLQGTWRMRDAQKEQQGMGGTNRPAKSKTIKMHQGATDRLQNPAER